jgi:hypothetical protein
MFRFPEDINDGAFELEGRPDYHSVMRAIRAYFDLCFEEWYMKQRGLIDDRAWLVWKGGMRTAFSKPAFQQAWELVKRDTEFGQEFEQFVATQLRPSE